MVSCVMHHGDWGSVWPPCPTFFSVTKVWQTTGSNKICILHVYVDFGSSKMLERCFCFERAVCLTFSRYFFELPRLRTHAFCLNELFAKPSAVSGAWTLETFVVCFLCVCLSWYSCLFSFIVVHVFVWQSCLFGLQWFEFSVDQGTETIPSYGFTPMVLGAPICCWGICTIIISFGGGPPTYQGQTKKILGAHDLFIDGAAAGLPIGCRGHVAADGPPWGTEGAADPLWCWYE